LFNGVSTSGTSVPIIQIGNTTIVTTGYAGGISYTTGIDATITTGFPFGGSAAANVIWGSATLTLLGSNIWVYDLSGFVNFGGSTGSGLTAGGVKTLSGTLDRIRLTTVNGTDTFDLGSVNILYE
jgi:hypothetical protein